jgi:hypothetical protein
MRDGLGWRTVPKSVKFAPQVEGPRKWELHGFYLDRNNFIFNNKIILFSCVLIFHLISLIQHWMASSSAGTDSGRNQVASG